MNSTDYTYLLNKPDALNERHTNLLEKIINQFPYFQSARILKLKYLYNQDSFKYNFSLKVAAAFTTDRSVLFDFITSTHFNSIQNGLYDLKVAQLLNIEVIDSEIQEQIINLETPNTLEQSIKSSINNAANSTIGEKLELGKPLEFSALETHSFQEWLQLSRLKPIERTTIKTTNEKLEKDKKTHLIDKFILTNPKVPSLNKESKTTFKEIIQQDNSYLMTETLAKVYLEQKKFQRAIQAYEILILKYPEKSSFFADLILEIKILQQNNS